MNDVKRINHYQCGSSEGTFISERADTNHFAIHGYRICDTVKYLMSYELSSITDTKWIIELEPLTTK